MKIRKAIKYISAILASICIFVCSACGLPAGVSESLVIKSIKTISEYGVYFGAKSTELTEEKAKIIEESFRVCVQVLEKETVDDYIDVDEVMANVPDFAKVYAQEAITLVNSKYVELKGKIPANKIPYIKAVFEGGFAGIENYRKSLKEVVVSSGYEVILATQYEEAKKTIK